MTVTTFAFVLLAATPLAAPVDPPAAAQLQASPETSDLSARTLAAGRPEAALAALQRATAANPDDAALLINLGIAYAQQGQNVEARRAFEAALACDAVIELETADGTATDSRRLARKALKMLDRGAFRPDAERSDQLTYRN